MKNEKRKEEQVYVGGGGKKKKERGEYPTGTYKGRGVEWEKKVFWKL